MTPNDTETMRGAPLTKTKGGRMLARLAGCSLVAVGLLAAAIAPASADNDDWGHGHGHHKHHRWNQYPQGPAYGYYYAPPPPPVYYAPPPPPVYYQPAPVYYQPAPVVVYPRRPSVSIVFPIDIH